MTNLIELAKQYRMQRELVATAKRAHDEHKKAMQAMEEQLVALMLEEGVKNLKLEEGEMLYRYSIVNFRPADPSRWPDILHWLRDNGNESLIKESVHPKTFTAFCKEQEESGADLPDAIVKWEGDKIGMRRS